MPKLTEDKLLENPDWTDLEAPVPGDRVQLRVNDGFRELVLVQVNKVTENIVSGKILGFYDWESKGEVINSADVHEFRDTDIEVERKFVFKVVKASSQNKAKWISSIALERAREIFEDVSDISLEEIIWNEGKSNWDITVGFIRNTVLGNPVLGRQREYKIFRVDSKTGEVIAVQIRLPSA